MPEEKVTDLKSRQPYQNIGGEPPGRGGGDGSDGERIAALETHLRYLATKEDLTKAVKEIGQSISDISKDIARERSTLVITGVVLIVAAATIGGFIVAALK